MLRRPPVIGEEQQAEPDLADEQRLREREQMGEEAARLAAAVVRPAAEHGRAEGDDEDDERERVVGREHTPTLTTPYVPSRLARSSNSHTVPPHIGQRSGAIRRQTP